MLDSVLFLYRFGHLPWSLFYYSVFNEMSMTPASEIWHKYADIDAFHIFPVGTTALADVPFKERLFGRTN
jgi:hypothetical protein